MMGMARMNWDKVRSSSQKSSGGFYLFDKCKSISKPVRNKPKPLVYEKYDSPFILEGTEGLPCPSCGKPSQVREHFKITKHILAQAHYHTRWFYCQNRNCNTTTFFDDRYKVKRVYK
jgi:hypothetical protein